MKKLNSRGGTETYVLKRHGAGFKMFFKEGYVRLLGWVFIPRGKKSGKYEEEKWTILTRKLILKSIFNAPLARNS